MMRIYCLSHKHPAALFTFLLSYELYIRHSRDFSRITFEYENALNLKPIYYLCHEYLCNKFLILIPRKFEG